MRRKFLKYKRKMTEMMDLMEEILSDEYEEGEILDEDILYEDVSSLEEFSDSDDKKTSSKSSKNDSKKPKRKRTKEHQCKENSVCRNERSGKRCYARIRIRRNSSDGKLKHSNKVNSDVDKKSRPAARQVSPTRGAKRDFSNKDTSRGRGKADLRSQYPPYYAQHGSRHRPNPLRRNTSDRKPVKNRRFSCDDQRDNDRKRKSRSPTSRSTVKHVHDKRSVAKSSLLDRLVGSGSIPQKTSVSCDVDQPKTDQDLPPLDVHVTNKISIDENESVDVAKPPLEDVVADEQCPILCPEDIPVPPTPKAGSPVHEPPKEEIDELNLRLVALKTAIMKKQNDYKRKKRLAASKKSNTPGNDSFVEFALMVGGDDEESVPTPPPPGTDWPPLTRDLDDPKWSDEDMVIDQDTNYDTIIEANVPATDTSLQNCVVLAASSSPSSRDKLPCCKGNPIPVVSPHRPAKEVDRRTTTSSASVIIPVQEIISVTKEPPKYLKEINSNMKPGVRRRRNTRRPRVRRRRNSIRQRTPVVRKIEKRSPRGEPVRRSRKFDDDDEDALRQLALMSVKPKNSITGGMLAKINENIPPLHIETNTSAIEFKPEFPVKNPSPTETWEDLDEDILRAQLLSSLSRNIPGAMSQPQAQPAMRVQRNVPLRNELLMKRLNKENVYTKRNVIVQPNVKTKRNSKKYVNPNATSSLTPPLNPVVEKFIIRVSESETSEDEDQGKGKMKKEIADTMMQKLDLESSIDKLLEEARKETELIQQATPYYPMYEGTDALPELKEETASNLDTKCVSESQNLSPVGNVATQPLPPQDVSPIAAPNAAEEGNVVPTEGISSLPAWQLEEFERQKRVTARKETIITAVQEKSKVRNQLLAANTPNASCDSEAQDKSGGDKIDKSDDTGSIIENSGGSLQNSVNSTKHALDTNRKLEDESCRLWNEVRVCVETLILQVCSDTGTEYAGKSVAENTPVLDLGAAVKTEAAAVGVQVVEKSSDVLLSSQPLLGGIGAAKSSSNAKSVDSGNGSLVSKLQLQQKKSPGKILSKIPNVVLKSRADKSPVLSSAAVQNNTPPAAQHAADLPNGVKKSLFSVRDSSYALKGLNEMNDLVSSLERGMSEYRNFKKDFIAQRKQLMLLQKNLFQRRQLLLEMKDKIENKKRLLQSAISMDTSALSPLPDNKDQLKQYSRANELMTLKFKEVCLKAQFAMMGLETASRPQAAIKMSRAADDSNPSPKKKMKLRTKPVGRPTPKTSPSKVLKPGLNVSAKPATSHKFVVSVRDSDKMDPLIPLCPYDMKGVCKDEECQYQHLKN